MHIQVNSDSNIAGTEQLGLRVREVLEGALTRFASRISRVEVHLSDQNGDKTGDDDMRCLIEARVEGRQPTVVTHRAGTMDDAIDGAAEKMKRSLESTLERLRDSHRP